MLSFAIWPCPLRMLANVCPANTSPNKLTIYPPIKICAKGGLARFRHGRELLCQYACHLVSVYVSFVTLVGKTYCNVPVKKAELTRYILQAKSWIDARSPICSSGDGVNTHIRGMQKQWQMTKRCERNREPGLYSRKCCNTIILRNDIYWRNDMHVYFCLPCILGHGTFVLSICQSNHPCHVQLSFKGLAEKKAMVW